MKAREGDLIETYDGNIFDVKGHVHPSDKIIAFIRFTPDLNGERKRDNVRYRKVYPLHDRYELLRERFPQYLVFDLVFSRWMCEVPTETVKAHYEPVRYLAQLRSSHPSFQLEKEALEFGQLLQTTAGIEEGALGVSGSLLVGLATSTSDIDLIAYGSKNCRRVHQALRSLVNNEASSVKPYSQEELKKLFDFRSKDTTVRFEDFVRTESRKYLQGKFHQRDYFIRCVKEWDEISETYGDIHYEPRGEAKIKATIADDTEAIFTPCIYRITNVKVLQGKTAEPIQEIVSFRGRFCEQARKGEIVFASGIVERVRSVTGRLYCRLMLGNKTSDCMILAE